MAESRRVDEETEPRAGDARGAAGAPRDDWTAVLFAACILLASIVLAASIASLDGGPDPAQRLELTPAEEGAGGLPAAAAAGVPARRLFQALCSGCHELAAVGAAPPAAGAGPDLDRRRPDRTAVLAAIRTGPGEMPAGILSGRAAERVAAYVARVAGR